MKLYLQPCSLKDFLDYLIYVEHSAENLQFYLWYRSYVERFNALSEQQKRLSPIWNHEKEDTPDLPRKSGVEEKVVQRVSIINEHVTTENGRDSTALSHQSRSTLAIPSGLKWQPFTIQPIRDEVNRAIHHYLAFSASRELNLSHRTRATVLHALQHTTHPSAFEPAFIVAEASLQAQSHPNFIRWSICNGSQPRIFFVRGVSACTLMLGTLLAAILTCSEVSRWWRLSAGVFWWIGASGLIAAAKGLCVILHHTHSRMLRPWEDENDVEKCSRATTRRKSWLPSLFCSMLCKTREIAQKDHEIPKISNAKERTRMAYAFDENYDREIKGEWSQDKKTKCFWGKVFRRGVWVQDERLRVLQDRIVLGANLWAAIRTTFLLVIVLSIPRLNVL